MITGCRWWGPRDGPPLETALARADPEEDVDDKDDWGEDEEEDDEDGGDDLFIGLCESLLTFNGCFWASSLKWEGLIFIDGEGPMFIVLEKGNVFHELI